eukprot:TRINITY_DN433_c0_g1_i3.p1 TRINITY_DN433_c0_g1~~TRINITY_DN433_c0_g1_i3.p1  ORF type:complete len:160 (+),score=37.78 TRINITY_DN433_c0_g1_i3:114-593(+)
MGKEKIKAGDQAPDFTVKTNKNEDWTLSEHRGKWIVLFFYPAASTYGCTREAKGFADAQEAFTAANAEIVGISTDPPAKQETFIQSCELPFTLLCDTDNAVGEAYGRGKQLLVAPERVTFVIDPEGVVRLRHSAAIKFLSHVGAALECVTQGNKGGGSE